ncbi:hypothetical protein SUDANB38_02529 [Streptomyces sp. enrichment culture]
MVGRRTVGRRNGPRRALVARRGPFARCVRRYARLLKAEPSPAYRLVVQRLNGAVVEPVER